MKIAEQRAMKLSKEIKAPEQLTTRQILAINAPVPTNIYGAVNCANWALDWADRILGNK